jgi:hypothetical protein
MISYRTPDRDTRRIIWPEGKQFAFTVIDDTDRSTVKNVGPIYQFLTDEGLRTTKTVWPLAPSQPPAYGGQTLEEPAYREWVRHLAVQGFEIAFHGATDHSSPRAAVIEALDRFRSALGQEPRMYVMHGPQKEALYWGEQRLDGPSRSLYRLRQQMAGRAEQFLGHVEDSPYFWGDICQAQITYVRNFVFRDVNTLRRDPIMPYHDPRRPYVPYWFSASEGGNIRSFCELLREENQDRLLSEGGACIAYTHFASGFTQDGRPDAGFVRLTRRLARLPGWFVPASTLLDHLKTQPGWSETADRNALGRMQWEWTFSKARHGRS